MKRLAKNRFVRQIMAQVCESDPHVAVHNLVAKYGGPSENLDQIAEKLGVREITLEKMGFDGGVFEDASGLRIKLNIENPPRRRRFTLAHELAHLIIASGRASGARRSHACTELERACDVVAAELLMPMDKMRCAGDGEISVENLLSIAREQQSSLQATALRLHELGIWNASFGQWSWDGVARELWFVGRRFWREKGLYLAAFERAVRHGTYKGSELIESLGRGVFPVFLDVRRLGAEKLYLLAILRGSVSHYRRPTSAHGADTA